MSCHTLKLTGLAALGAAVGRLPSGMVVFVPGGAPEDVVLVEETEQKKGYMRARLLKLLERGACRVEPACQHAAPDRCGGCPWMHISRDEQLRAKEELVRRALRHTGAEIRPIIAPAPVLGYRLRARLTRRGGTLGFVSARSHHIEEVSHCPVLMPALDQALFAAARRLSEHLGEDGSLRGVVSTENAVHLSATVGRGGDKEAARRALMELIDEGVIVGASLPGPGEPEQIGQAQVDVGASFGPLLASADSFAQASLAGHEDVVALLAEALPDHRSVLELYAGSGNLTRALCTLAESVVAVESEKGAAARLSQTVPAGRKLKVLCNRAAQAIESFLHNGERFDAVVLDPPRGGAREIMDQLPLLGVRRVVYLSCDPMTLGRDLCMLLQHGFRVRYAQPVDLMPHTAHVETLAVAEIR